MNRKWSAAMVLSFVAMVADADAGLLGFDLSNLTVPRAELLPGGPPRDGIPALTDPEFLPAARSAHVSDEDRVIGVFHDGVAKAYPLSLMNWHEIVNDVFGDSPLAVTYCPLCGTGVAFVAADKDGRGRRLFGVSGLLYNSDVVLYDRGTESLWSQLLGRAISGPLQGQELVPVPVANTTWKDWRGRHPNTLVLSDRTGYTRDYGRDPYGAYATSKEVIFPVRFRSKGFHPKQPVLGIVIDGVARAWPLSELSKVGADLDDRVGGRPVRIHFDAEHLTASITDATGAALPGVQSYWFAWYAFHPQTEVFRAGRRDPAEPGVAR